MISEHEVRVRMTELPDDAGKGKGKTEATADRIKYLVEDEIQQQPYEFDGQMWAARSQQSWCDQLGGLGGNASPEDQPVAVRPEMRPDRWPERDPDPPRRGYQAKQDYRNIMSKIWRDKRGRSTTGREFGLICGLMCGRKARARNSCRWCSIGGRIFWPAEVGCCR